jgi:hypothetical protein
MIGFLNARCRDSVRQMYTYVTNRRLGALVGIVVAAVLAAGCSGNDAGTDTTVPPTTTTTVTTTTSAPETTTGAPATTTTQATATTPATTTEATTTTASTTTTAAPTTTTVDVNTLADGSGCTPGSATLGDGRWFGYVDSATATEIEFDLACWFTGDAAAQAAAEDGEESPPPNDYYIRNQNSQLRTLTVAATAQVSWLPNPGDPSTQATVPYPDWLSGRTTRDYQPGVWVTIAGGKVTMVEEQYVP